jgi:16S rRNA (cytosine1402-N4)-methyltransferase
MTDTGETTSRKNDTYVHRTVLLHESIDGLGILPGDIYLDGTLGSAGHAIYAASKGTPSQPITIIGIDQDEEALERSEKRLAEIMPERKPWRLATITQPSNANSNFNSTKTFLIKESYRNLDKALDSLGIDTVNRIMLDLGLSSDQFETSGRGFSFQKNEPLLMTFKSPRADSLAPASASVGFAHSADYVLTARDIINKWEEANIADVIYGYGEERYARRIARAIVETRAERPIETTFDLVDVIKKATPVKYHHGKIHPATKTFQALRITVNDEIGALKEGLVKGFKRLAAGGRMAVISFHSIEDRIVKNFYRERAADGETGGGKIVTKKPLTPGDAERAENPRSRSAKLRIIEKI